MEFCKRTKLCAQSNTCRHGKRIIHELYRLGFAEVREGRKPQPTGRINEIMRVLTRYVLAE